MTFARRGVVAWRGAGMCGARTGRAFSSARAPPSPSASPDSTRFPPCLPRYAPPHAIVGRARARRGAWERRARSKEQGANEERRHGPCSMALYLLAAAVATARPQALPLKRASNTLGTPFGAAVYRRAYTVAHAGTPGTSGMWPCAGAGVSGDTCGRDVLVCCAVAPSVWLQTLLLPA